MVVPEVVCVHGANEQALPIAGQTVGWVRRNLRDALNLPFFAEALVNDRPVGLSYVLAAGTTVEFLLGFGIKGSGSESPEVLKARRLLRRYPELTRIGDEIKAKGLDADEAVDLALASIVRHLRRRFGPVPASERATLQIIAESVARIEERLLTDPVRPSTGPALSIQQAAKAVNLSESHIRRVVTRGELPASNMGTAARPTWRIARADLDAWIEARKGASPRVPPRSDLKDLIRRHLPGL
jgi:excisionase family DNA binding protein